MWQERPVQRYKETMVRVKDEGNGINSNMNEMANETWSYKVTGTEFEIAWNESMKLQKTWVQDLKTRQRSREGCATDSFSSEQEKQV